MNPETKWLWMLALMWVLPGCGPHYFQGQTLPDLTQYAFKRIALLPFEFTPAPAPGGKKQDEKLLALAGVKIEAKAPEVITEIFREKLEKAGKFAIIPLAEVDSAMDRMGPEIHGISPEDAALKLGKVLQADAILGGSVFAYQERRGGPLAVDRPATVGFTASLISMLDGKTLWTGQYFERQQSLTENIALFGLLWERHGRWLTARELAAYGVEQALKTWPVPQQEGTLKRKPSS